MITWLILTHITESFNHNLVETQNIILDPKKRVGALLKFRVQETRKTCRIFIEMEEVQIISDAYFLLTDGSDSKYLKFLTKLQQ